MELVDSNEKQLSPPEIITTYFGTLNLEGLELTAALGIAVKTLSMENAITKQIGNTLFYALTSPKPHEDKLVGGAFNADTMENFMLNAMEYIQYLKDEKYTKFISDFNDPGLLDMYRVLERKAVSEGMLLDVIQKDEDTFRAILVIDPDAYGDLYKNAGNA